MSDYTYYKFFPSTEEKETYRRGYLQGYRAGYADGKEGRSGIAMDSDDVAELPIGARGCPPEPIIVCTVLAAALRQMWQN